WALVAITLAASTAAMGADVGAQAGGLGPPRPFNTSLISTSGAGRIDPGLSCTEGGEGGYWHYDYEAPLASGVITGPTNPLLGTQRLHLDLHSEERIVRATPGEPLPAGAWLQGTESAVTFSNQRGTVRMDLRSAEGDGGSCDSAHTLGFDGITATGGLTWEITETTGSYREAEGAGTATLRADVAPGADNPGQIDVAGNIAVLQPSLKLEVVDTYWAFLGAHYLIRYVTVIYRVTNDGPGDAFNVRLTAASSPTVGVQLVGPLPFNTSTQSLGPIPQHLADIPAGQSEIVRLRWGLPNPSGDPPCNFIILGCKFDTTLTFEMPDALDVLGAPKVATVQAKAPDFPPPVVD
ncbi:MAG: hypothetical protein ACRDZU_04215, partial [Acidimicrobiales bacterium]